MTEAADGQMMETAFSLTVANGRLLLGLLQAEHPVTVLDGYLCFDSWRRGNGPKDPLNAFQQAVTALRQQPILEQRVVTQGKNKNHFWRFTPAICTNVTDAAKWLNKTIEARATARDEFWSGIVERLARLEPTAVAEAALAAGPPQMSNEAHSTAGNELRAFCDDRSVEFVAAIAQVLSHYHQRRLSIDWLIVSSVVQRWIHALGCLGETSQLTSDNWSTHATQLTLADTDAFVYEANALRARLRLEWQKSTRTSALAGYFTIDGTLEAVASDKDEIDAVDEVDAKLTVADLRKRLVATDLYQRLHEELLSDFMERTGDKPLNERPLHHRIRDALPLELERWLMLRPRALVARDDLIDILVPSMRAGIARLDSGAGDQELGTPVEIQRLVLGISSILDSVQTRIQAQTAVTEILKRLRPPAQSTAGSESLDRTTIPVVTQARSVTSAVSDVATSPEGTTGGLGKPGRFEVDSLRGSGLIARAEAAMARDAQRHRTLTSKNDGRPVCIESLATRRVDGCVTQISVRGDSTYAVGHSRTGSLSFWNLAYIQELARVPMRAGGEGAHVRAPSSDTCLLFDGADTSLYAVDSGTRYWSSRLPTDKFWAWSANLTPDRRRIVVVDGSLTLWLLDAQTGTVESIAPDTISCWASLFHFYDRPRHCVCDLAPNSRTLAVALHYDRPLPIAIDIADPDANGAYVELDAAYISQISISPAGRIVACACDDARVRILAIADGAPIATLKGAAATITALSWCPCGTMLIGGDADGMIFAWDATSAQLVGSHASPAPISVLSRVLPDGRFACGTELGYIERLALTGLRLATPLCTPIRKWITGAADTKGEWDSSITAECPYCLNTNQLDLFDNGAAGVSKRETMLGDEPVDGESRSVQCPACGKEFRLNNFTVDNQALRIAT